MHQELDGLPITYQEGGVRLRQIEWGDMNVAVEQIPAGLDLTPLLKGLPDDRCQCPHWGYLFDGRFRVQYARHEETIQAGELYHLPPGHIVVFEANSRYIELSPKGAYQETLEVIEHNLAALSANRYPEQGGDREDDVAMHDTLDETKLEAFLGQVVGDLSSYAGAVMGYLGDRLGLYRAMADGAPISSAALAARTGTSERYLRDWLVNQAAGGYVEYDPASGRYRLPLEQAVALTDESSPAFVGGAFQVLLSIVHSLGRVVENVRTGQGMLWGEHHPDLFEGTERFFKPAYIGSLVSSWIPALDGVQAKLAAGGCVADVGCGHGATTIIMAQAFPSSRFVGFDYHEPSIERARRAAAEAGVADRVEFHLAESDDFPGGDYDLVTFFDCLHDMARPEAAARRAFETLKADGSVLLVEPMAGARVEDNFNPVGRLYAAASVLVCTPNAVAGGGTGLGTIASDQALAEVFDAAGFRKFRRATETPFNRIFEAHK